MTHARTRRAWSFSALLGLASILLTMAWVPPAAAAGACNEQGNYEVCSIFGGAEDTLLARKMIAKINATATTPDPGDYIRVAMYAWRESGHGKEVADALVRAKQNGVSVRIVMGTDHVDPSIVTRFRNADIDLVQCVDACMSPYQGAMHNKFIAIKKGATKLVLQTSTNLDANQAKHAQNMLIVRDDSALFSAYVNYWRRLYARSWTWDGVTWDDEDKNIYGSNGNSRVYFFPQYSKQPLPGVLAGVTDCEPGNDRVWVQASHLDDSNFTLNVVNQLDRLRAIGCDVRIIVQKQSQVATLSNLWFDPPYVRCDGYNHSKLVLIDAKYAGEWRKAVFVGSYNLSENSNHRANDAMLRIIDGWVTNRYIDQFNQQWTSGGPCDNE